MEKIKINQKGAIKKIIKLLKEGKVVACPTDTVYGLIADATNKRAVERIFKIKKRAKRKPIPVFVKDLNQAKKIAKIDKKQEDFLRKAWPGKVTAVLERKKTKIKLYGVDKKKIALRVPKYKLVNTLNRKLNFPLSETSANISEKPPIIKIQGIIRHFQNRRLKPDLILDAGNLPKNKPSTVLDLTEFPPKILRK